MPTPLDNCPRTRQAVYLALGVASLVIGSAQAYFAAMGHAAPSWLHGAMAVYDYLAAAVGYLAWANTPKP